MIIIASKIEKRFLQVLIWPLFWGLWVLQYLMKFGKIMWTWGDFGELDISYAHNSATPQFGVQSNTCHCPSVFYVHKLLISFQEWEFAVTSSVSCTLEINELLNRSHYEVRFVLTFSYYANTRKFCPYLCLSCRSNSIIQRWSITSVTLCNGATTIFLIAYKHITILC